MGNEKKDMGDDTKIFYSFEAHRQVDQLQTSVINMQRRYTFTREYRKFWIMAVKMILWVGMKLNFLISLRALYVHLP